MADKIKVGKELVENYAVGIKGATAYFTVSPLLPSDNRSTIYANGRGQEAYYHSQDVVSFLGNCLEREAKNIRSISKEFEEYDQLLATLWEKCPRNPMIQAPQ